MKTKKNSGATKDLPSKQREELLGVLKTRFEKNLKRHKGVAAPCVAPIFQ